jgi:hypothetical protein
VVLGAMCGQRRRSRRIHGASVVKSSFEPFLFDRILVRSS